MLTNLTAQANVSGSVALSWKSSGTAEEIVVMWRPMGTTLWTAQALSRAATSFTIAGLTLGETYQLRVLQDASDVNGQVSVPAAAPTPTPPAPSGLQPHAPLTGMKLVFAEEFDGSSLNTSVWDTHDGWTKQNGVTDRASNVHVANGIAALVLSDAGDGAAIECKTYQLAVGDYVEASVDFAGSGAVVDNWPAWWVSGPNWPAAGENDIAEGLGTLTVNYHSPSGAHNTGTVAGVWTGAFHAFGIHRLADHCDVYWDGELVRSYATNDNGQPENLILTIGAGNTQVTGVAGELQIDYVRAFRPVA